MYDITCKHCGFSKYLIEAVKECPSCKNEDVYCIAEFDEPPDEHPEYFKSGKYGGFNHE